MTEHICPSCHCSFKQEFLCTTCGAEKLKDETTKQLERALHSKAEALMMQTNEIESLRQRLAEYRDQITEIPQLMRRLAECERERDEWRIRFGNEEYLRRTEQKIQSVSYLLSDGTPVLMPIISIKNVSDGRFVVVDNPCQEQLATVTNDRDAYLEKWGNAMNDGDRMTAKLATVTAERDELVAALEDAQDIASKALRKAWQLGQTYWQQADSEYISHHRKADETQAKFQQLVDETRAALSKVGADKTGEGS